MAATPRTPPKSPDNGKDDPNVPVMKMRQPIFEKPIKLNHFQIDKLNDENAIYWFHVIESQLKDHCAWEAIETYAEVGPETYAQMVSIPAWKRVDMTAHAVIHKGLSPSDNYLHKNEHLAGQKWDSLKDRFLPSSSVLKAMKLKNMAQWTQNPKRDAAEAWTDLKKMKEEFIFMNGGKTINIDELFVVWYLSGLGPKYSNMRDRIICSDNFSEDYVSDFVRNQMYIEKGLRKMFPRTQRKGPKCWSCRGFGHKAARCPNNYS